MDIKNLTGEVLLTVEADTVAGHDFYKAQLPKANFAGVELTKSRFYKADLQGADFSGACLKSAELQVANLEGANLKGANLSYANLIDANLSGADLTDANISWAVWKGTKYNRQTKFPKGFRVQDHELFLEGQVTAGKA